MGIEVRYSPVRHPESNPTERVSESWENTSNFLQQAHKKWQELVPQIERWLNCTVCETIGYAPIELLNGEERPDLFKQILRIEPDQQQVENVLPTKLLKSYANMKLNAEKRNKRKQLSKNKWKPKVNESVLVKCQHTSDATQGIMGKFHRPYEGPYIISKTINPNMYEVHDEKGRPQGLFHVRHVCSHVRNCE
jgi:hypothetical protein